LGDWLHYVEKMQARQ